MGRLYNLMFGNPLTHRAVPYFEETPHQSVQRLRHLTRGAHAVREKMQRIYQIGELGPYSPEQLDRLAAILAECVDRSSTVEGSIKQCWTNHATVKPALTQCAHDYLELFELYHALKTAPVRPGYDSYNSWDARSDLYDIYANHCTNAAEARLAACGFDGVTAHRINGILIRDTVNVASEHIDRQAHINPPQLRPTNDTHARAQIDQLRGYWRKRVVHLCEVTRGERSH